MSELVQAELIAEPAAVTPGEAFWVGLRLRIKERWHVYWRNPGDSGEAVAITWTLPPGFAADPIVWPTPSRIPIAHLVNFGHERETVLLTRIVPPAAIVVPARPSTWLRMSRGWCARRSAFQARRDCRSLCRLRAPAWRPASIRAHARSSMRRGHPCRSPHPGPRAWMWDPSG